KSRCSQNKRPLTRGGLGGGDDQFLIVSKNERQRDEKRREQQKFCAAQKFPVIAAPVANGKKQPGARQQGTGQQFPMLPAGHFLNRRGRPRKAAEDAFQG